MARFSQEGQADGSTVLRVGGEIDLSVTDELVGVAQTCLQESRALDLDLGDVTFIDSSGLGVLVRLKKEADAQSKAFRLVNTSVSVQRLLEVTGLGHVFSAAPS